MAQPFEDGQGETGGFTGAGLGCRHQIPAGKHGGDRLQLNFSGFGVAAAGQGLEQGLAQAQLIKTVGRGLSPRGRNTHLVKVLNWELERYENNERTKEGNQA